MTETLRFSDAGDASEGELVSWLVEPGDHVAAGDLVAEVETDKSLVEVTASVDSVVESLSIEEGSVVAVGDALATVDPDADADSSSEADASSETDASPETDTAAADPVDEGGPDEAAVPSGRVFAPPSVRRLARERDVDLTAVEGTGPSGRITAGDVTDYVADRDAGSGATANEPSSPKPLDLGSDDRQSAVRGQEASAGATDAEADESSGPTPLDIGSDDRSSAVQSRTAPSRSTTLATPATRRLADELDVDLDRVPTDETRDGEAVVDEDRLRAYAAELAAEERGADAVTTGAGVETGAVETASTDTAVPPSTSPTAGTATAGTATTATATVVYDTATVDAVLAARDRLASRAADGDRPSLLAFVAKAVAVGLDRHPALGVGDHEADAPDDSGAVRVGVATADGLATTLVEDAADRGVFELTAATTADGDAAEDGGPAGSDGASSAGPAFTLTAPGALGREHVAPAVTNSAPVTLALGAVEKRPTVREASDGTADVVAASTIPLSLAVDPSVADGAAAAAFLETVIERLEEPLLFLTHQ